MVAHFYAREKMFDMSHIAQELQTLMTKICLIDVSCLG